jgi:hypothetical protein
MNTAVEISGIQEAGPDYLSLRDGDRSVRINFADGELFGEKVSKKEDYAAFFRGLEGQPVAIPPDGSYIAVDLWYDRFTSELKVIPFPFAIASIERS